MSCSGPRRPGVGEPAAQVHLPGHEPDQRDRPSAGAGFDQRGQLLGLSPEELPVLHPEGEPEHQLVDEQYHGVVAESLGVCGDRREPGVEVEVAGLRGVGGEEAPGERGHQPLALLRAGGGRAGGSVGVRGPRAGAEQRGPRVVAPDGAAVELGQEALVVAEQGSLPLAVGEDPVAVVHGGDGRARVQLVDLGEVAAEQRLLQRLVSEHVEGQPEDLLVRQGGVVFGDRRLQPVDGSGRGGATEDRVQHGHEVALARPERPGQERRAALPGGDRLTDHSECLVERPGEVVGDDVVPQRLVEVAAVDGLAEPQHVVLVAGPLRDGDQLAQQRTHRMLFAIVVMRS